MVASRLRQFLTARESPGHAEGTAQARIFYSLAATAFVALSVATVNDFLFGETGVPTLLVAALGAVGVLVAIAVLGHFQFASASLPLVALAISTGSLVARDGVHDTWVVGIAAVLVFASILLKRRTLVAFTIVVLAMIVAVGYAEMEGVLHNRLSEFTTVRHLIDICLSYLVIALTVRLLTETLFSGLREAREKSAALAESHANLEHQAASLKQSEARFAKMIQASPAATTITRFEDGTFVEANQAALDLFGRSREEVIGQTALSLGIWPTPEDRAAFVEALRAGTLQKLRPERMRRKSGEIRDCLISATWFELDKQKQMLMAAVDVTDITRAEMLLRRSEERFAKVFQASPGAIVISRLSDGRYLEVNEAWLGIFGYSREELIGRSSLDLGIWVDPADRARFVGQIRERGALREFEARLRRKSGAVIDALLSAEAIDIDGESCAVVPIVDITDRKRAEERIQQLATRDALTGLPNRLLLNDRLMLSIGNAQRQRGFVALLFIDLDRFKYINDSLGHAIGDAFLQSVAERLSVIVRKSDTLARLGGDEFVVLLERVDAMEDAAGQVARKILASFTDPFSIEGHTLSCSCSIGISIFPSDTSDPQMLVRDADTAMYHVKESGRGSYRYFSQEMNSRMQERLQLEIGLREAIANHEFELVYQPKVSLSNGGVTGLEALLRWRHPEWGMVPPGRFISVAEDTGLIVDIGKWVIDEACRQLRDWRGRTLPQPPVAINLSVRQLTPTLIDDLSAALERFGVVPELLELELTESVFMKTLEGTGLIMKGLLQMGTPVTIDDFGTGYSSLSYIRHFAANGLKIDRTFVSDIAGDPQNVAIVRAIIAMAHGLGMRVIAEGVETQEQLAILADLHCDEYQGYLFSPPVAPEQIEQLGAAAGWMGAGAPAHTPGMSAGAKA